ncbi:hypothetical protein DFH27DRAFT_529204 [Peziza echinospora]|nr:hypothetical protein DFH27DRAFT_529204 [Peziza echinospora]
MLRDSVAIRTRFDPAHLPKFKEGDDVDSWLAELTIDVNQFSERILCPMIYEHCFHSGSSIREWYLMLPKAVVQLMTEGDGCFKRFSAHMRERWDRPLSMRQRFADKRKKRPEESFQTYFYANLKLLSSTYPESEDVTHLSRIRSGLNDPEASLYIRERNSILQFVDECRKYYEHLNSNPRRSRFAFPLQNSAFAYKSPPTIPVYQSPTTALPASAQRTTQACPGMGNASESQRTDPQLASLSDRLNATLQKIERSFLCKDSSTVFLDRPCQIGKKMGNKNEMHFSFECPFKASIKSLVVEFSDTEDEDPLPGVHNTPRTDFPTSYTFNVEAGNDQGDLKVLHHGAGGKSSRFKATKDVKCDPSGARTSEPLNTVYDGAELKCDPIGVGPIESVHVESDWNITGQMRESVVDTDFKCDPVGAGTIESVPTAIVNTDVKCDPIGVGTTESVSSALRPVIQAECYDDNWDGKSYTRIKPLYAHGFLGHPSGKRVKILQDVCSNAGLIDRKWLQDNYPDAVVIPSPISVHGVGDEQTLGHTKISVFIEGFSGDRPVLIELQAIVHVLDIFRPGILIALDTLLCYKVVLDLPRNLALLPHYLSFKISSNAFNRHPFIRSKKRVVIPRRVVMAIRFHSRMSPDIDYMVHPHALLQHSAHISAIMPLPHCVVDSNIDIIMFQNPSSSPIIIENNQILGLASAIDMSSEIKPCDGLNVDWADMMKPGYHLHDLASLRPPKSVSKDSYSVPLQTSSANATSEEMLDFLANTVDNSSASLFNFRLNAEAAQVRHSISTDEVKEIAANALKRTPGEVGNAELEDETLPIPDIPSGPPGESMEITDADFAVGDSLTSNQKKSLQNLLMSFKDVFSHGDHLGHVQKYFALIETVGPLPPAQQPRPMGPAKRAII